MRICSIIACLGLWTGAAAAQEDLQWISHADEYGASLIYGVPQTSFAPVSFHCESGSDALTFTFEFEPVNATDGVGIDVIVQAGALEVPIETTGMRLEMDDLFILQGETLLDDRMIDLLLSDGPLLVFVEDGVEEYALEDMREGVKMLARVCGS